MDLQLFITINDAYFFRCPHFATLFFSISTSTFEFGILVLPVTASLELSVQSRQKLDLSGKRDYPVGVSSCHEFAPGSPNRVTQHHWKGMDFDWYSMMSHKKHLFIRLTAGTFVFPSCFFWKRPVICPTFIGRTGLFH